MIRKVLSLALFVTGVLLVVASVVRGEASLALLLFIPIIYGGGWMMGLGILLIISSFLLLFLLPLESDSKVVKGESKYGGVVFIGPIPFVFGSDTKVAKIMMYIGLAIALILLFLYILLIM